MLLFLSAGDRASYTVMRVHDRYVRWICAWVYLIPV
jgi:uncharacterized membrane protein YhaH (DUF805 family)